MISISNVSMSPQAITPVSRFHDPASRAPSCLNRLGRSPPGLKSSPRLKRSAMPL